jgi:hypothetical protein
MQEKYAGVAKSYFDIWGKVKLAGSISSGFKLLRRSFSAQQQSASITQLRKTRLKPIYYIGSWYSLSSLSFSSNCGCYFLVDYPCFFPQDVVCKRSCKHSATAKYIQFTLSLHSSSSVQHVFQSFYFICFPLGCWHLYMPRTPALHLP